MKKTIINGLNIVYTELNTDKLSAIVFIHGNSHSGSSFDKQAACEALKDYRQIFINLPGHGQSQPADKYTLPFFAEIIQKLTEELQLKSFMIVGHSLGGHVALHALQTSNPSGVMIYGTPPLAKPLDMSGFLPNLEARALGQEICTADDLEDFLTALNYNGQDKIQAAENFKLTDPRVRTSILESVGTNNYFDECELIKNYDGKLMVLVSEYENLVNNNYIAKKVEEYKPETLKVFIKAGHVPHVEKPLEFNRILADFARETFSTEKILIKGAQTEVSLKRDKEFMITKEVSRNIAALFKSTRKFHKLHQTEFSAILGVTQGTISKIESGLMGPELGLWFKFLKSFNIKDPYCFTYAGLEFNENAFKTLKTNGSILAPKFNFKDGPYIFTVQKIRPLFDFLLKNHGKVFEAFLKENKISHEIFYILNHPLSYDFVDTFFSLLDDIKINEKSIALLDLNFNSALGRHMDNLLQSSSEDFFSIINSEKNDLFAYEAGVNKGEYFITMNANANLPIQSLKKADFIMNYNMLYPYHVMKSTQNLKATLPSIKETSVNHWQVQYAQ